MESISIVDAIRSEDGLTEADVQQLTNLIGHGCREPTRNRLKSILAHGASTIPIYGILDRVTKDGGPWTYCAGQSFTDEIRTVKKIILYG